MVDGRIDVDMPYSSLSMLDSVTDERVFYAIYLDGNLLTGYPELIELQINSPMVPVFSSGILFDVDVRIVTVRRQIGKNEIVEVWELYGRFTTYFKKAQNLENPAFLSINYGSA